MSIYKDIESIELQLRNLSSKIRDLMQTCFLCGNMNATIKKIPYKFVTEYRNADELPICERCLRLLTGALIENKLRLKCFIIEGNKNDSEKVVENYYLTNFNIKLIRCTPNQKEQEAGVPDYKYEIDNHIYWVEVKTIQDGLRYSQIEWLAKRDANLTVVYVV